MNALLKTRLQGLQRVLMAHHHASTQLANAAKGGEREIIVRELLGRVVPSLYRFGTGQITDSQGQNSGQVDIVVEWPFGVSLPMLADTRLYLAESVAAAIEVKSDLRGQWSQVAQQAEKLNKLTRVWQGFEIFRRDGVPDRHLQEAWSRIPVMAIGFTGFDSAEEVQRSVESAKDKGVLVDAAFVIDSGAFYSAMSGSKQGEAESGFLAFLEELSYWLQNIRWAMPDTARYQAMLNASAADGESHPEQVAQRKSSRAPRPEPPTVRTRSRPRS